MSPPVTAMTIFSESNRKLMAKSAVDELMKIMSNGFPKKGRMIEIDHQFIERESVRSLKPELANMEAI
jgi:DNA-binding LacI/PurR family transcriptional regulator